MNDDLECMCTQCGISVYLPPSLVTMEDFNAGGEKLVLSPSCPECGGRLFVIGKAGEEPYYRVPEEEPPEDIQAK